MNVLHTHWHYPQTAQETGQMILWAETGFDDRPRKQKRPRKAKAHPFALNSADLTTLLEPKLSTSATPVTLTLWLPTTHYGPLPSPELSHMWELDDPDSPTLHPWTISGLAFSPLEALPIVLNLSDPQQYQFTLGADSRYWQTISQLLLETLAQQKYMPTFSQIGQDYHARWFPMLDSAADGPRTAHLLAAMPPLCRAEATTPAESPSPRLLYDTFLNIFTDTFVRAHAPTSAYLSSKEVGQAWVMGLINPKNPQVKGVAAQLSDMNRQYRLWLRNLHVAGNKQFRVALRLEAPVQQSSAKTKSWQLYFLLQSREDPSLLIPTEEIWCNKPDNILTVFNQPLKRPQETIFTALGFAGRLFPPLKQGLKTATPQGVALHTEEAFTFLREAAPLLEASGFGVLVPPWWNKPGMCLGVRVKLSSGQSLSTKDRLKGHMSLSGILRYQWNLSMGENDLTEAEFQALVDMKSPLVQIRGQWVQLDAQQIEAALTFFKKYGNEPQETTLLEALRLSVGGQNTLDGLPVHEVVLDEAVESWLPQISGQGALQELPPPEQLQATLRPYQQYGYSWMHFLRQWGLGACLADDMGLGKTIQTISLLQRDKETGVLSGPSLLICPTSVVANWEREIRQFAPTLRTMMHQGTTRLKDAAFVEQAHTVDMVLTSYPLVRRDKETLKQVDWYGVILDEAQHIKNPETKQTQAIRQLPAQFRVALTGTPVENRLSELWSIMQFLNPNYLGSQAAFRKEFARPIEREQDAEATQRLQRLVKPFILRRVKTDPTVIQDLPDKIEMKSYCNLSQEQATLYESVVKEAITEIDEAEGISRKGLVLSMLMKLKQICNHPGQFLHQFDKTISPTQLKDGEIRSGKVERLTEMLEEIVEVGDKTLIFSQFSEMGHFLQQYLQQKFGLPTLYLYGGTPTKKRAQMVNLFQQADGPPIFILSLKAGGTGLNLTQANHVFHFDRWWNPAVENQATDRAFRIGQTKNVQVHKFVCTGTLEEMIDDMIESKKALAESVVGKGENWLTELSTTDLRELVKLRV